MCPKCYTYQQKLASWNSSPDSPDSPDSPEIGSPGAGQTLGSTRAGSQDDGSYTLTPSNDIRGISPGEYAPGTPREHSPGNSYSRGIFPRCHTLIFSSNHGSCSRYLRVFINMFDGSPMLGSCLPRFRCC